jgi:hypothetical protein
MTATLADAWDGAASQAGGTAGAVSKSSAGFGAEADTGVIKTLGGNAGGGGTTRGRTNTSVSGLPSVAVVESETAGDRVCAATGSAKPVAAASKASAYLDVLRMEISE